MKREDVVVPQKATTYFQIPIFKYGNLLLSEKKLNEIPVGFCCFTQIVRGEVKNTYKSSLKPNQKWAVRE